MSAVGVGVKVLLVVVFSYHGHKAELHLGPYNGLKACVEATQQYVAIAKKRGIKVLDTECEWSQEF